METYRIWLYGYSVTLLLMLIGFVFCLQTVVTPVWISLFPFSMTDTIWFFLYTNLALQGVDIALCLYGVACNKPIVLQVFWVMGLVLLFADVLYFGLSVPYWQRIINSTDLHLYETLMLQYSRPSFCVLMNGAQKQFGCCGARSYTDFSSLPNLCDEI
ncbi:unnamed protein product, partial [Soboliphyme baturini]|uniref:PhoLip_ATPase_C domain-containing protein n=1 Tax=Soboliphyme baturini TaxID=241478 RepID=A0A183IB56_9BILA